MTNTNIKTVYEKIARPDVLENASTDTPFLHSIRGRTAKLFNIVAAWGDDYAPHDAPLFINITQIFSTNGSEAAEETIRRDLENALLGDKPMVARSNRCKLAGARALIDSGNIIEANGAKLDKGIIENAARCIASAGCASPTTLLVGAAMAEDIGLVSVIECETGTYAVRVSTDIDGAMLYNPLDWDLFVFRDFFEETIGPDSWIIGEFSLRNQSSRASALIRP